jgi:hypothetical protein
MSNTCSGSYIDGPRTVPLDDVGGGNLLAATLIGADYTCLALVDTERIADGVPLDAHCRGVLHEQSGKLPIEFAIRLAVAARSGRCSRGVIRCGRRTRTGAPCRIPVTFTGDACHWHRTTDTP